MYFTYVSTLHAIQPRAHTDFGCWNPGTSCGLLYHNVSRGGHSVAHFFYVWIKYKMSATCVAST
jgi:hypothetical protein